MIRNFWILALVIIIIWGSIPIMLKSLTTRYPAYIVMLTTSIMFGLVAALIGLYFIKDIVGHARSFTKRDWLLIIYIVIAGSLISNMLYLYALEIHDSTIVVTVTSIFPIVTLLMGVLLLKQQYNFVTITGVVLVTAGVMCLSYAMNTQK